LVVLLNRRLESVKNNNETNNNQGSIYGFYDNKLYHHSILEIKNQYNIIIETEKQIYKYWFNISPFLSILITEFT
jgi:hypothetical protein